VYTHALVLCRVNIGRGEESRHRAWFATSFVNEIGIIQLGIIIVRILKFHEIFHFSEHEKYNIIFLVSVPTSVFGDNYDTVQIKRLSIFV